MGVSDAGAGSAGGGGGLPLKLESNDDLIQCVMSLADLSQLDAFLASGCLSFVLSKGLGYGIVLASLVLKLPQVLKIISAGNSKGVSLLGYCLETFGYCVTTFYNVRHQFPLSTYGEAVAILVQDVLVIQLMCFYQSATIKGVGLLGFFAGWCYIVLSVLSMDQLQVVQGGVIVLFIGARTQQIVTNFKNKTCGQLSMITVFMQMAGSVARVFTTLKEVDDQIILASFLVSATLNGFIFLQFFIYDFGGSGAKAKAAAARTGAAKKNDDLGAPSASSAADSGGASSAASTGKSSAAKRRPRRI